MSELIEQQPQQIAIAQSDSSAVMSIIQKAASDPSVDMDKLERLMLMHERMQSKNAEQAFNAAMAQMQCEIPTVGETGLNTHTKNAYATLDDINVVLKPIMQRHGFSVMFKVDHSSTGISVTGILMHSAGHREQTTMLLPVDAGSGRNAVQAVGSSTTYGKRYVMCALLNITTGDQRDDDGHASQSEPLVTQIQAKQIEALLEKCTERTKLGFEKLYGISEQVPKSAFDGVVAGLRNSISKAQEPK